MSEKIIKTIPIYNGKILDLQRNLVSLPNDELAFREIVKHKEGVCIIPVHNDEIIFVSQFRSGAEKVLLELPAGIVDENESSLDAALRELQEETKCSSTNITYLGGYYSSPGFTNELVHLYLAEDLYESPLAEDKDEFIELFRYNIKQIKHLLTSNAIADMKTALGLMIFLNTKNDQSN